MPVVAEVLDALLDVVPSFEVIVVDDGSTDGTRRIADEIAVIHPEVRVIHFAQQRGYGVAWREGLAAATKQYAFFVDPNRRYSPQDLELLVKWDDAYDIVAGSRTGKDEAFLGRLAGYAFRAAARLLFGLKYRDINSGFALIRLGLLRGLDLQSTTKAIHAEVLCRANQVGAKVREVEVRYVPRSPVEPAARRFRLAFKTFRELSSLRAALVREKRQAALEAKARRQAELHPATSTSVQPTVETRETEATGNSDEPIDASASGDVVAPAEPRASGDAVAPLEPTGDSADQLDDGVELAAGDAVSPPETDTAGGDDDGTDALEIRERSHDLEDDLDHPVGDEPYPPLAERAGEPDPIPVDSSSSAGSNAPSAEDTGSSH
jgi:hypothetical protein